MVMDKEKAIIDFAEWFLKELTDRCVRSCGKAMGSLELPVFKKFLSYRVSRELEFYKECLGTASALHEHNLKLSKEDIMELIETSKILDKKLLRDIRLLPLRIDFNYKQITPLRAERAEKQVKLFIGFLSVETAENYPQMVQQSFSKTEYLDINNDILELYTEEAFIINSTIKSIIKIDSETLAHKMYCMMLDVGFSLNREIAEEIYGTKQ